MGVMDAARALRDARRRAGLSQQQLADLAATSQATISAYESGRKQPTVATMSRLLAATGERLRTEPGVVVRAPSRRELERRGRILRQVVEFAETFPFRRAAELGYPRLRG